MQRDLAEERHAELVGFLAGAAMAEDLRALAALGAEEIAHVLDDAEYRHGDLAEHVQALARVDQRDVLRRRDDDGAGQRHALRQRELGVTRAGRHVDHQHVEVAPGDVAQHLLQRARHHGPAPDHRRVLVHDVADRHGLEPEALDRLQLLAVRRFGLLGHAQHARHRGAVDVGVEQPDREAVCGEAERQVDCGGRLADAALARGHGDDVLHARHVDAAAAARGLSGGGAVVVPMRMAMIALRGGCGRAGRGRRPLGGHHGGGGKDAWHGPDRLLAGLAQRLEGGAAGGIDIERHRDMTGARGDAAHHAQRFDTAAGRRIDDGFENLPDGRFAYFRHVLLLPPRRIFTSAA